ncbi:hypothetical protein ABZP36_022816 [Zizania latifolia]
MASSGRMSLPLFIDSSGGNPSSKRTRRKRLEFDSYSWLQIRFESCCLLLLLAVVHAADAARGKNLASSFLAPHNAARRKVGLPPLAWDEKLAAYVRAELRGGSALMPLHRPYGENEVTVRLTSVQVMQHSACIISSFGIVGSIGEAGSKRVYLDGIM